MGSIRADIALCLGSGRNKVSPLAAFAAGVVSVAVCWFCCSYFKACFCSMHHRYVPWCKKKLNWSQPARDAFAWLYLPLLAVAASPAASGRPPSALTVARLTIWRFMCLLAHASYEYLHVQLLLNLDRRNSL